MYFVVVEWKQGEPFEKWCEFFVELNNAKALAKIWHNKGYKVTLYEGLEMVEQIKST